MEKEIFLLNQIQISPNALSNLTKENYIKYEETLKQLINDFFKTYRFKKTNNIKLYIEICLSLFNRIIENNQNDFEFIKNMYDKDAILKNYQYIELFSDQIKYNFDELKQTDIDSIIDIIGKLPKIKKNSNWQVSVREICLIFIKNIFFSVIINSNSATAYDNLNNIKSTCEQIILSPIPNNLNDKARSQLIDIIYYYASFYIMGDEPNIIIAFKRLEELNAKNKIKSLKKIKIDQLKTLDELIPSESNHKKKT